MILLSRSTLYRVLTSVRVLIPALALLSFDAGLAQTPGTVDGLVRDASGLAMPGLPLTLTADGSPVVSLHTTTDKLGAYHFGDLAPGSYRLSSDSPAYAILPDRPIAVSMQTPALRLDVNVTDVTVSETSAKQSGREGLQLQAAGIRGYIDPGGYSAPAGAAAASDLIQGAAGLNHEKDTATAKNTSACSRQPALLKAVAEHPENAVYQRQLGEAYLAMHQPEEAVDVLQHAWALDSRDKVTLSSLAEAFLVTRRFAQARDLLTAYAPEPRTAAIHRLLARSDEGLGAFHEASLEYQAAAEREPTEADFYGAGYEQILAGSPRAAVDFFQAGLKLYPDATTLLTGMGTADFLEGNSAEATHVFLRVASLHPSDFRIYPFLSASFAISGTDPSSVETVFRQYCRLAPDSADAAYFYALILLHTNADNRDQAEKLLKRAVILDPDFAHAHLQLGSLYLDQRDYADAAVQLASALRLDPTLTEARYKLATAYRRSGQAKLAEQQMQLFLASTHNRPADKEASQIHVERYLSVFNEQRFTPAPESNCGVRE